jgi:hypothetical protein
MMTSHMVINCYLMVIGKERRGKAQNTLRGLQGALGVPP